MAYVTIVSDVAVFQALWTARRLRWNVALVSPLQRAVLAGRSNLVVMYMRIFRVLQRSKSTNLCRNFVDDGLILEILLLVAADTRSEWGMVGSTTSVLMCRSDDGAELAWVKNRDGIPANGSPISVLTRLNVE